MRVWVFSMTACEEHCRVLIRHLEESGGEKRREWRESERESERDEKLERQRDRKDYLH